MKKQISKIVDWILVLVLPCVSDLLKEAPVVF